MSKFKDILINVGLTAGKQFVPPAAGNVLDEVVKGLAKSGPTNAGDVVQTLAKDNDEQTQAILALHARLSAAEAEIVELKKLLGR